MDPVAIAAYLVQSQQMLTQGDLGVAMVKQMQSVNNQVVGLVEGAVEGSASYAPGDTGQLLNVTA